MSQETRALIIGLKTMLKNRGSVAANDVKLIKQVISYLEKHDQLNGDDRLRNGVTIVGFLLKLFTNPNVNHIVHEIASKLIEGLH